MLPRSLSSLDLVTLRSIAASPVHPAPIAALGLRGSARLRRLSKNQPGSPSKDRAISRARNQKSANGLMILGARKRVHAEGTHT